MYDARLFNQSEGMGRGFGAEDDYNVYSAAWRAEGGSSSLSAIYRPMQRGSSDGPLSDEAAAAAVDDLQERAAKRFKPSTDFEGVERGPQRGSGPVEFERGSAPITTGKPMGSGGQSSDPFNLDAMLGGGGGGRRTGNALDAVGKRGFMSAAGGAAARSAAELGSGSGRTIEFQNASS
jgi:SNW domain-containing protein 1